MPLDPKKPEDLAELKRLAAIWRGQEGLPGPDVNDLLDAAPDLVVLVEFLDDLLAEALPWCPESIRERIAVRRLRGGLEPARPAAVYDGDRPVDQERYDDVIAQGNRYLEERDLARADAASKDATLRIVVAERTAAEAALRRLQAELGIEKLNRKEERGRLEEQLADLDGKLENASEAANRAAVERDARREIRERDAELRGAREQLDDARGRG
jgi:hypothetical protein